MKDQSGKRTIVETPSESTGVYWTTFCFEGIHPLSAHCTHKYLGELDDKAIGHVIDEIEEFYSKSIVHKFDTLFDDQDEFKGDGVKKTVTVFKANSNTIQIKFGDLRERLDAFRDDDFTPYKPHVTSHAPLAGIIDRYALCKDDEVIQEWKFQA